LPRSGEWYRQGDLITQIKEEDPDFQRPDGNYETWYIRLENSDVYITGFENWENVEGRLLAFLFNGPLSWLGLLETSKPDADSPARFRLTARALDWLAEKPVEQDAADEPIIVHDDASISVPLNADRYRRFQVARVTEALPVQPGKPFRYQLTPRSLASAADQGIDAGRLLTFLTRASGQALPASTERAIKRWEEKGTEARIQDVVVLRVADAEIIKKLRDQEKTRPFLGEVLGDLAVVIRKGEWQALRQAAASLGLLLDHDSD
jgi:hypothetical protein